MPPPVEVWAAQVRAGEVRAISRAITAIENHAPEAEGLLRLLFPHTGKAHLTGVTGAPGTGKSAAGCPHFNFTVVLKPPIELHEPCSNSAAVVPPASSR